MTSPFDQHVPVAFFNALQFEASLRHSKDPVWRVRCANELERYELAVKLADDILAERQSGDALARKALALESLGCDMVVIRDLNEEAIRQGSRLGYIGLARLACSDGDYERANSYLDPVMTDACARFVRQAEMMRMQCLILLKRDAAQVRRTIAGLVDALKSLPLYDTVQVLIFLLKAEHFSGNAVKARYLLSVLDGLLAPVPLCRFHRVFAGLRVAVEQGADPVLSLNGSVPASQYKQQSIALPPSIDGKPTLAALFEVLAAAGSRGADKCAIVASVWGLDYDVLKHDARFYKAMERFKRGLAGSGWSLKIVQDRWVLTSASEGPVAMLDQAFIGPPFVSDLSLAAY